ncbi:H-2 class II histocompatibility antigen, E-S beta chain-like [Gopherus evgoodei]|uniref:H-2 class II histocompatibility antigen, E-S beta chain-like n=1 Tax=Gopherus evgoodei TaxID=1825980 RepID=UPI0011CF95E7|nr:H-2 class II histocompatibility antigen, E-S beta chain-like [Gopherus evgoodei]
MADTELGRPDAEGWNKDPAILADQRAAVDTFCRHNYGAAQAGKVVGRTVQPKVKVSPTKSGSQPHPHLLVCSVTGFYPSGIEIKWLKNGQEQTAGVVSTELLQNGDWTFQILVMLEMSPRRRDVYTCQVEHISLRDPLAVHWEAQSDSARSKMLTGVGGFVLGLIFLAPGLLIYLKNKKGRPVPQPAGLQRAGRGEQQWGESRGSAKTSCCPWSGGQALSPLSTQLTPTQQWGALVGPGQVTGQCQVL